MLIMFNQAKIANVIKIFFSMEGWRELFPVEVKLPEIQSGSAKAVLTAEKEDPFTVMTEWLKAQPEGRLIVQEKIDGSNFTVWRDPETLQLLFFNKGKRLSLDTQRNSTFVRTCDILRNRPELFRPGYIYHGESMRATRASHIMYRRIPKYHWICYEILIPEECGYRCATPEELTEIIKDTGIEQTHMYYDSERAKADPEEGLRRLAQTFIEVDSLYSCLGNYAEGFVVKVLSRVKKDKVSPYRRKYVASHMRERKVIEGMISPDCTVEAIGDIFNVPARHRKAVQHLEERGEEVTYEAIVAEADADLEKEYAKEVSEILMQRYWPIIKKAARKDLAKNLGLDLTKK